MDKLLSKIHFYFAEIFRFSISALSYLIPIKKKIAIFASTPDFSDNAWVLYDYLKHNRTDIKLYWATNSPIIHKDVDCESIIYTKKNRIKYTWLVNRASYLFSTHGIQFPKIKPRKQLCINLAHGGVSIKKNKGQDVEHNYSRDFRLKTPYDYILCRSQESVTPNAYFYCCDKSILLPLGMIRDDLFIKNIGKGINNPFYNGVSKKLILWMPTFRISKDRDLSEHNSATETGLPLLFNKAAVDSLNEYLSNVDVQLLVKPHPLQLEYPIFNNKFTNITFIKNEDIDNIGKQLYEIVGFSDALITDYSSIYFDYLIADKPVGFILDDIDQYYKDRGFVFDDPTKIMAGNHIYNIDQMKEFIEDVLTEKDKYRDERKKIKDKYVGEIPQSTAKRFVEYFNL